MQREKQCRSMENKISKKNLKKEGLGLTGEIESGTKKIDRVNFQDKKKP